jgi:hypothetical protein
MTSAVITPPATTGVRCSDADRERTSERIRVAAGEGRVTMDELEDRLAGVYGARYRHDLDELVADLPDAAEPPLTGWRAILAMVFAQLGADLRLLFGRGGAGWTRRRVVLTVIAALAVIGVVAAAAFHGFGGGGGFEHRGFGPDGFEGGRHGF